MRWDEPAAPEDLDEPFAFDGATLFIGMAVVGLAWICVVIIVALVILASNVIG